MDLRYQAPLARTPLSSDALRMSGPNGTWVEPPGEARRFLRYAPEFIDDPDATGLFRDIGAAVYRSPPVFVSGLSQADVVGYRTVISGNTFQNDEAYADGSVEAAFLRLLASTDPFPNEETCLRPTSTNRFVLQDGPRRRRRIEGETVVLCSHEPSNYGSFLFRVLPKLQTLKQANLAHLPMLVWAWPEPFKDLLALFDVPEPRIIQHDLATITRLDRAIVPSLRNPNAFLDQESHAAAQRLARRCAGPLSGRRLYISRLRHGKVSGSGRVMLNEEALVTGLGALNFEIMEPERLGLSEQIAAFQSADMIVGPSGSALFNTMFCRPGTKVIDIESEPDWIYAHTGLFASCQTRYGLFVGRCDPEDQRPVHRRWMVNIEALMDRVSDFIHA